MTTPTVLAYCCSVWEVTLPWGRCGLCGERPTMTPNVDAQSPTELPQGAQIEETEKV